jgi:hypothetical protein
MVLGAPYSLAIRLAPWKAALLSSFDLNDGPPCGSLHRSYCRDLEPCNHTPTFEAARFVPNAQLRGDRFAVGAQQPPVEVVALMSNAVVRYKLEPLVLHLERE